MKIFLFILLPKTVVAHPETVNDKINKIKLYYRVYSVTICWKYRLVFVCFIHDGPVSLVPSLYAGLQL